MMTTLTEENVRDAYYAFQTRAQACNEETTPQNMIAELANTPQEEREGLAQFERGVALLRDYIVLMSDRSIVGGRFGDGTAARIVSPIVSVPAGYVATHEAYRAVALAQR